MSQDLLQPLEIYFYQLVFILSSQDFVPPVEMRYEQSR